MKDLAALIIVLIIGAFFFTHIFIKEKPNQQNVQNIIDRLNEEKNALLNSNIPEDEKSKRLENINKLISQFT